MRIFKTILHLVLWIIGIAFLLFLFAEPEFDPYQSYKPLPVYSVLETLRFILLFMGSIFIYVCLLFWSYPTD